ncbi:MAG: Fibronectin type domain protein [Mucilaginibacter sp.]|nr:Fibronectin type domain protein [Mucilaginibacter sp.]
MKKNLPSSFLRSLFAAKAVMIFCFLSFVSTSVFSQASVQTDQPDYPPGSTVYITGSGFTANETVTLQVLHVGAGDDLSSTAHQPWTTVADASGNINTTWLVPPDQDELGATLQLTAVGASSGLTAQATFTDGLTGNLIITSSPSAGIYGGTIALTATFTQQGNNNPIAGKIITFKFNGSGGTTIGTAVTDASGGATLTVSLTGNGASGGTPITVGTYPNYINASFAGDGSVNPSTKTGNLTVNPRSLTVTATGPSKTYGTALVAGTSATNFTAGVGAFSEVVTGVTLTPNAAGLLATTAAGSPYSVTPSLATGSGGFLGSNYNITYTAFTGTVGKASLTVTATGPSKTYGTALSTGASSTNFTPVTGVNGEVVTGVTLTPNAAGLLATTAAGSPYSVTPSLATGSGGFLESNYNITYTAFTGTVGKASLTITATGTTKVYDGTTTAPVTLSDNRVSGDVFTETYTTAIFTDKNVGTGKPVSVTGISISGGASGNYTLSNTTASTTASITTKPITVTATGINKIYDGTAIATVTLTDDRVSGDVLTDAYTTATFANKDVASGKTVTVSGISISGTDAANYTLNSITAGSTTASITQKTLTVTAHGVDKIYDSNTTATVTFTDDRVSGDVLTDAYTTATFASKDVATGKTVSVSGISISGTDAGNYTLNSITTSSTTAGITQRTVAVTAHGVDKVYDGNATAAVTFTDDRVSGDALTYAYTAVFNNKNAGTGKAVSVTGISINGGTDAGNYTLNSITTSSTTANITQKALAIAAHGIDKVYDGNTTATVTLTDNRVASDLFNDVYATATFANAGAGTGKTVSVSGISISGTDAGNYTLNGITTATTTANITPLVICASYNGVMFANTDVSLTSTNVNLSIVINTAGSVDARTASVKFTTDNNGGPYTAILDGTNSTINQAIYYYNMPVNIGNNLSQTTQVNWTISQNFQNDITCSETSTDVTVSTRTTDFVTGGGFVKLTSSAGTYKGDNNSKTNFGFNVKWNKSLSNIQGGGFNSIIRSGNLVYHIKAAKVLTLLVTPRTTTDPATAAFTSGNATVTINNANTDAIISSIGNLNLTVEITDACEPGSGSKTTSDLIAITLKDAKGVLLYSNNWNPTTNKTDKQYLTGGNLQVQSAANTIAPVCGGNTNTTASLKNDMPHTSTAVINNNLILKDTVNPLSVKVYPNPSISNFNLQMTGGSTEKLDVKVTDVLGHLVGNYKMTAGSSLTIGDSLRPGIYIVQVKQGDTYKFYRIYKTE